MHFKLGTEYAFVRLTYTSSPGIVKSGVFLTGKASSIQIEVMECVHVETFANTVGYQFLDRHSKIWVGEEFADVEQRVPHDKRDPGMVITRSDPLGKREHTEEFFTLNFVVWKALLYCEQHRGSPPWNIPANYNLDLLQQLCFEQTGSFLVVEAPPMGSWSTTYDDESLRHWISYQNKYTVAEIVKKLNDELVTQGLAEFDILMDRHFGVTAFQVLRCREDLLVPYAPPRFTD